MQADADTGAVMGRSTEDGQGLQSCEMRRHQLQTHAQGGLSPHHCLGLTYFLGAHGNVLLSTAVEVNTSAPL